MATRSQTRSKQNRAPSPHSLPPPRTAQTAARTSAGVSHWLLKTEPSTYSFHTLLREGRTNWNDVRNFQARNFLRTIRAGDLALIYHSGEERAVVGIAEVIREAYPDPDPATPKAEWVQIDLRPIEALTKPVPLRALKESEKLRGLLLLRQSRLSVMPVTEAEFQAIRELAQP
jgi:predicted RNA-binding protein with PUA-like domain